MTVEIDQLHEDVKELENQLFITNKQLEAQKIGTKEASERRVQAANLEVEVCCCCLFDYLFVYLFVC